MSLTTRTDPRQQRPAGDLMRAIAGREPGYSLVELLVATTVLTLLLGGLMVVLTQTQGAEDVELAQADMRQQARLAAEQLATEIRMLGANIDNLPEALITGQANSISFATDVDAGDPAPPCSAAFETAFNGGAERIAYRLQGNQLLRTVDCWDGAGWTNEYTDQVVAQNVASARLFRYFDTDGVEIVPAAGGLSAAERDAVRVIRIQLAMDDGVDHMIADTRGSFLMSTQVRLRNAGT